MPAHRRRARAALLPAALLLALATLTADAPPPAGSRMDRARAAHPGAGHRRRPGRHRLARGRPHRPLGGAPPQPPRLHRPRRGVRLADRRRGGRTRPDRPAARRDDGRAALEVDLRPAPDLARHRAPGRRRRQRRRQRGDGRQRRAGARTVGGAERLRLAAAAGEDRLRALLSAANRQLERHPRPRRVRHHAARRAQPGSAWTR